MAIALSVATRNARLQCIINQLDAASTAGKLLFYTGPRPASGAAITTQTLLGTCELSKPSGSVAAGVLTFNPISDDVAADADGEIAWVRALNGDLAWVLDMDAGIANSGATMIFNTTITRAGGVIQVLSGSFTEGNT